MNNLTPSERELVALGAAMGSNCVPCIEYHIPEARKAGLADSQISEAIRLADRVRQVPARKVLDAALKMLPETSVGAQANDGGCAATPPTTEAGARCCS
ncbi:MAG: carboxymuconolactone decarboxylase family protein [Deltaproteobacteria bacterium]|nr:carboxymuconolactone decarboxylase family protein [Deltaproteobacteria bacterium]MBI3064418.1 carboxymuconolactone decarboxylase family protein [Deltaproteobacteria bacterium]